MRNKLEELKKEYENVLDEINLEKANGSLSALCNLRNEFDETFDQFFDRKELRIKYENKYGIKAWNYEDNEPNFEICNRDLEEMLNEEDLQNLISFYEGYIEELRDELIVIKNGD